MEPFTTSNKLDMIRNIKEAISLPKKNAFVKNASSIRICYYVRTPKGQPAIRYINLPTVEDVAIFLKKHGVIKFYTFKDNSVKMFRIDIFQSDAVTEGKNKGAFIQLTRPVEYRWCDIEIFPDDLLHYAACHEFELLGGILGITKRNVLGKKGYQAA